jgi:hypothetical protein
MDGVKMQITLNIYERGYHGTKQGKALKNFVRFFSHEYLLGELYVQVPSVALAPDAFSFEFGGHHITVFTKSYI